MITSTRGPRVAHEPRTRSASRTVDNNYRRFRLFDPRADRHRLDLDELADIAEGRYAQ
jgi:hypothetical protein